MTEELCFCRYEATPVMCPTHGVLPTFSQRHAEDEEEVDE